jgi:hypothetical protein
MPAGIKFDEPATIPSGQHNKWSYTDLTGAPWLVESYPQEYNREGQTINVPDVLILPSGTPLLNFSPLQAKDIALCTGLLLDDLIAWCFPISGPNYVGVLVRGRNTISMAFLPDSDWKGVKYDKVAWAARLEALGYRALL